MLRASLYALSRGVGGGGSTYKRLHVQKAAHSLSLSVLTAPSVVVRDEQAHRLDFFKGREQQVRKQKKPPYKLQHILLLI